MAFAGRRLHWHRGRGSRARGAWAGERVQHCGELRAGFFPIYESVHWPNSDAANVLPAASPDVGTRFSGISLTATEHDDVQEMPDVSSAKLLWCPSRPPLP